MIVDGARAKLLRRSGSGGFVTYYYVIAVQVPLGPLNVSVVKESWTTDS